MFAAASMLFATSCSNDELNVVQSENEAQVTFSLGLEGGMGSRAISDGKTANKLVYAVYDADGNALPVFNGAKQKEETIGDITEKAHPVTITLAKGQTYQVAFWAQNSACKAYNTADLKNVQVSYKKEDGTDAANNDEVRDAFYKTVEFTVAGDKTIDVILKRPFAQINVGVYKSDWEAAVASGVTIEKSDVVIKNAATSINLLTGAVGPDTQDVTVTYSSAAIPTEELKVDLNNDGDFDDTDERYAWLSMSYILVADHDATVDENGLLGTDKATLSGLEYTFTPKSGEAIEFKEGLNGAPVRRNWRTNILGKILTGDIQFNITINPIYDGDYKYPDGTIEQELEMAATFGGTVTLTEDVPLTAPLNVTADMVIDLNGHTISGAFAKADNAENAMIQNNANLTIVGGTIKNETNNGDAAILNNGNLILDGATITGAPLADGGYSAYAVISSGKLTINEGTVVTADRGCLKLSGTGETVINGGKFTNNDIGTRSLTSHVVDVEEGGTHKLTINGGTFEHLHTNTSGGVVICNRTKGTVYVNGGSFSGGKYYSGNNNLSDYGYGGTFSVKGGTFSENPTKKYIANGYKAVQSGSNFVVVSDDIDAVASNASELSTAIANGDANIVLAEDITYNTNINNNAVINLNNNTFEAAGTITLGNNADLTMIGGNYEVNGTYGHVDVRPSSVEGCVVTYEDVNFSYNKLGPSNGPSTNRLGTVVEVCATVTDAHTKILFKNCTFDNAQVLFEGLSGTIGTFEAVFENCTFNALTSSAPIYVQNYVKGTIKMTGCTFNLECTSSTASAISVSSSSSTSVTVTAENNTINAVAATPYTYDPSKGETEVHNIKVNGTPANIKFISISGSTSTATETGTVKTGIAG